LFVHNGPPGCTRNTSSTPLRLRYTRTPALWVPRIASKVTGLSATLRNGIGSRLAARKDLIPLSCQPESLAVRGGV
jgi:hypothetical protein